MNYADILDYDTNNGSFFRVSMWVSGCGRKNKCPSCFNKKLWDFTYGKTYAQETEEYVIKLLKQPLIKGFSIIGGEPMDNLQGGELLRLVKRIRKELPHIEIFCWSGYLFEDLIKDKIRREFLQEIDMLRDGEFILSLKDLTHPLGGSSNQRQIDCKKSLKEGKVVMYNSKQMG